MSARGRPAARLVIFPAIREEGAPLGLGDADEPEHHQDTVSIFILRPALGFRLTNSF